MGVLTSAISYPSIKKQTLKNHPDMTNVGAAGIK